MPRQRYSAEEIINKLRIAEVELSKGSTVNQFCVCRQILLDKIGLKVKR